MDARKFTVAEIMEMIKADDLTPFYNSRAWRNLSKKVISENHNECCECRRKGKVSAATLTHHFNELKKRPELAYSRFYKDDKGKKHMQLMPLCNECHEKIHKRGLYKEVKEKFTNEERW